MAESNDALLGRIAVHTKMLSAEQLNQATEIQGRSGGSHRLGDIFVEKGFITPAQLQKLLVAQKQVLARQATERVAQTLAAVSPGPEPCPSAATASAPRPRSAPPRPAPSAAAAKPSAPATAPAVTRHPAPATKPTTPAPGAKAAPAARHALVLGGDPQAREELHEILRNAVAAGASDLHVHAGAPLRQRRNGVLEEGSGPPLEPAKADAMLRSILSAEQTAAFDAEGQGDLAYTLAGVGRFRANLYKQQRGTDGVFRIVPDHPPSLDELGLPNTLARLTNYHQGMVLVTGPSGCGKSSTMAAFLNLVNEERTDHILTIEDPIEVIHPAKSCQVNQRQVRTHTGSFARALRAALREDPDVIAIGELRDLETISLALTAAETGHFVLGTLHTSSTIRTIDRLIGVFPPDQQTQVRTMLSESLRAVVSQRLVVRADGAGRVPALEVLIVNKAISNLIRENKSFQIRSILQTGAAQRMCLLDSSLEALVKQGVITREEALRHAEEPKRFGGKER